MSASWHCGKLCTTLRGRLDIKGIGDLIWLLKHGFNPAWKIYTQINYRPCRGWPDWAEVGNIVAECKVIWLPVPNIHQHLPRAYELFNDRTQPRLNISPWKKKEYELFRHSCCFSAGGLSRGRRVGRSGLPCTLRWEVRECNVCNSGFRSMIEMIWKYPVMNDKSPNVGCGVVGNRSIKPGVIFMADLKDDK